MARGAPVLTVAVVGDTLEAVGDALQALVPCALPYALDPALQPQGWLSGRCRAVREPASGTLWVGVAAAAEPESGGAALSQEALKEREGEAARALLAAFLTSHLVLWLASSDRGQVLPRAMDLVQRLRLLQQLKGALLPALLALLGVPAGGAGPAVPGFCIPQLLVLAQPPHGSAAGSSGGSSGDSSGGGSVVSSAGAGAAGAAGTAAVSAAGLPSEAERASAERQLRLLLKRCRVLLPEDNARALCALPPAAPAVLCLPERLGSGGSQEQLVADALAELSLPGTASVAGTAGQQAQQGKVSAAAVVAAALSSQRAVVAAAAGGAAQSDAHSWHSALISLAAVLEAAALKASGAASEQPAADVAVPPEAAAAASWQLACSDGVRQFSLASCKRAAAVASDAYRRNTPDLLPAAGHAVAAAAALRLYRSLARGPAAADGAVTLKQQLDDYWQAGHQQCEAVSLLGNPCCLPVHDPQQQPHSSSSEAAKPLLLLATGSGGRQQRIPEPFTVAELQQAAAAVAAESASAAARVQFWVRRLGTGASAASSITAAAGQAAVAPAAEAALQEEEEEAAAGDRRRLSGGGRGSDDETEGPLAEPPAGIGADAASAAATRAAALGAPAAGCWLELHVLGPRSMYKSAALSAALLVDGQPGWLRAGGCMFAQLPLLVAVPGKPGQQPITGEAQEAQAPAAEEFPSLAEVKQQEQRRRRPPPTAKQRRKERDAAAEPPAEPQQPRLLDWPGWQASPGAAAASAAGPLPRAGASGRQQQQRGSRQQAEQQRGRQPQQATVAPALAAGAEQHMLLLGFEYESVAGQRLLLTPALLAAALQSSLDTVSVRQHAPAAAAAAGPGPQTAAAAAAAAAVPPTGAAAFLLQRDLPLWLQLPGEQLAQLAGKRRGATAGASGDRPTWLQLRRLLVSTPDVAIQLESLPELLVEVPADMLAPAGSPAQQASSASGGSSSASGRPTAQLAYRLAAPLALPPASFCVLALPWLLTAPMTQPSTHTSSSGSGTPTALIRQSGPLRAVLAAGTALYPAPGGGPL